MFLMPSRYEPCGLNQMYSLRYGTVPIVRRTGGLADSVQHFEPRTRQRHRHRVRRLLARRRSRGRSMTALDSVPEPEQWRQLVANGMRQDFSWTRQGALYVELYEQPGARRYCSLNVPFCSKGILRTNPSASRTSPTMR